MARKKKDSNNQENENIKKNQEEIEEDDLKEEDEDFEDEDEDENENEDEDESEDDALEDEDEEEDDDFENEENESGDLEEEILDENDLNEEEFEDDISNLDSENDGLNESEENNLEKNLNQIPEENQSKFEKLKEILQDKKKLGLIAIILIVFFIGFYFIFFKKSKSDSGEKNKNEIKTNPKNDENPYRINESALNDLPEIKIKPKEEKKEIVNELLKNNDILSLKIENELKIPEKKIEPIAPPEKKPVLPEPIKEEKKLMPLPMPPSLNQITPNIQTPLPIPQITAPNQTSPIQTSINNESIQRKIDANVIVFAGSEKKENNKQDVLALINGKRKTKKSSFTTISESYVGYKDRMILAGKIIDLVLETSINTEQEGMVRAIVASDVYSESGFNVLIPAGSRVLGKYAPVLKYGNFRVNIMFNRIVRPDGVDIILGDMKAVNKLGATGVRADRVDNKIGSAFGNSILIGALSLATLFASREIENLSGNNQKSSQNSSGSSGGTTIVVVAPGTSNNNNNDNNSKNNEYGSATRDIIEDSIEPLKQHLEKLQSDQTPVLFINQGRKVSIMTDKDIVFNDENAFVFYPEETNELGIR